MPPSSVPQECDRRRNPFWSSLSLALLIFLSLDLLTTLTTPSSFSLSTRRRSQLFLGADAQACNRDVFCGGNLSSYGMVGLNWPNCYCVCRENFEGKFCERCRYGFNGSFCDVCLPGFLMNTSGFCVDQCTDPAYTCSNHSTSLTGSPDDCQCMCQTQYVGDRCEQCAPGYSNYPYCYEDCTQSSVSCNNHAELVTGTPPECRCRCQNGFAGETCDQCAPGFNGTYAACIDTCTNVNSSCSFNGKSVSGTPPNCECECLDGYTGDRCGECAPGYTGYPECYDNCTNGTASCNGRGVPIGGQRAPFCQCACIGGSELFLGATCDRCSPQRTNYPRLCAECAPGYENLPICSDACTITNISCRGPALSVMKKNDGSGTCLCDCTRGYTGDICEACALGFKRIGEACLDACFYPSVSCQNHAFDVSPTAIDGLCECNCHVGFGGVDCGRCAWGYENYSTCVDNCSNPDVSCEGRADSVSGVAPNCVCQCKKNYIGASSKCSSCAIGFSGFGWPLCLDDCTSYAASCNNHATDLKKTPSGVGCICTCAHGYDGETCDRCETGFTNYPYCDRCAPGFSGWPSCLDDCTNATASCSGRGLSVGGIPPNCECYCSPGFAGTRCEACARGWTGQNCERCAYAFEGDPKKECVDTCTNVGVSCNNRALDVYGTDGNCTCICDRNRAGAACERCAPEYDGVYCDRCTSGYSGYPVCKDDCTNVNVSCGGRAKTVHYNSATGQCQCQCFPIFSGKFCSGCSPGYAEFPFCQDNCTLTEVSCRNNATAVFGEYPYCTCECQFPWAGRLCDECAFGYAGVNCTECASGFYGPSCKDNCTINDISCFGHALNVVGSNGNCSCSCDVGYAGNRCEQCAEGYGGWPNCTLACSNSRCNYHAEFVTGSYPNCTCHCLKQYAGEKCENCASNFQGAMCDECSPGYIQPPNCVDGCSNISVSCSGNADFVDGAFPFCRCRCLKGFAGAQCGGCDRGYEFPPYCTDACTYTDVSCNATNTAKVTGPGPYCNCICKPGFGGPKCATCAYGYKGSNCSTCAPGFTSYVDVPYCRDDCNDVAVSCNDRAFSVTGSDGVCSCQCIPRYDSVDSVRCDRCARGYAGDDCSRCERGFTGYPLCTETCTNPAVSCKGNGLAVNGSFPDCLCTCKPGWGGTTCDRCAVGYTGGLCQECAAGYRGYPFCEDACTNADVSCYSHAYSVKKDYDGSCLCDCKPQWALPNCANCFKAYTGATCNQCAPGYDVLPYCLDACIAPAVSCNGIGLSTNGNKDDCKCVCPPKFGGNRCEMCAPGYVGFPNCEEGCINTTVSCNDRATTVNGTNPTNCKCTCKKFFGGDRCERCAREYSGENCDSCAFGYVGYPDCVDNCKDPSVSCNDHGMYVTGVPGSCRCICQDRYTGNLCEQCASGYGNYPDCTDMCTDPVISCNSRASAVSRVNWVCKCSCLTGYMGDTCDTCAPGYAGYPNCQDNCTLVDISCNGHASNVTGFYPLCQCNCLRGFAGSNCSVCDAGYSNYPDCFDDCTETLASCNAHATAVNSTANGCVCDCDPIYNGTTCDTCAHGYGNYPVCHDVCTSTAVSCNGRALSVNGTYPACTCGCTQQFTGVRCERCVPGFAGPTCSQCAAGFISYAAPCDTCATGYDGYPFCSDSCTVPSVSCNSAFAKSVSRNPDSGLCECECYRGIAGAQCDQCAVGYAFFPNCTDTCSVILASCSVGATQVLKLANNSCHCVCKSKVEGQYCERCEEGYSGFPDCKDACENAAVSCGPNAVNVTHDLLDPSKCICDCARGWNGVMCDSCAYGFGGPNCTDQCLSIAISCSNRADAVVRNATNGRCECSCLEGFNGSRCDTCIDGYEGFPNCKDACTSNSVSCHGNAKSLSMNGDGSCFCDCKKGYKGAACEACDRGYSGFPTCVDGCTHVDISCNNLANTVSLTNTSGICDCKCLDTFDGARCEQCAVGYALYPLCTPDCTSTDVSCSGHAFSVFGSPPNCECRCHDGYEGRRCDGCLKGYSGYPICQDDCTNATITCGKHGIRIVSQQPSCKCDCPPNYLGDKCRSCASGYGNYPICDEDCSDPVISCNAHGVEVEMSTDSGSSSKCNCTCQRGFAGIRCNKCDDGFAFYPRCLDNCTIPAVSCHGHGQQTWGSPGACFCNCTRGYTGQTCDKCDAGFSGYPECIDNCTVVNVSCGGRATAVSQLPGSSPDNATCRCNCTDRFVGLRCDTCVEGRIDFPKCDDNCSETSVSCSGHAWKVSKRDPRTDEKFPSCDCNCHTGFAGDTCNSCAEGYTGYPHCVDSCTNVSVSCGEFGLNVSKTDTLGACACLCQPKYQTTLTTAGDIIGGRCESCVDGREGFPECYDVCTNVMESCGIHGTSVQKSYLPSNKEWNEFVQFWLNGGDGPPTAHDAARGREDNTTVTVTLPLPPPVPRPDSCLCNCSAAYTGPKCNTCDTGFLPVAASPTQAPPTQSSAFGVVVPNVTWCYDACTLVNVSCVAGHAESVSPHNVGDDSSSSCYCHCRKQYDGAKCDVCARNHVAYPQCLDDCTNVTLTCNGHGKELTGVAGQCSCGCEDGFAPPFCDTCNTDTHGGVYPNCTAKPTSGPPPPGSLIAVKNELLASAIRSGLPISDREFVLSLTDDVFNTEEAQQPANGGQEWFFLRCLTFTTAQDYAFGVSRHIDKIWQGASILKVNDTHLHAQFLTFTLFDIPEDVEITVTIKPYCGVRGATVGLTNPSTTLVVRAEQPESSLRQAASGMMGATFGAAALSGSPGAVQAGQALALLGAMGCAKKASRATSGSMFVLSPFGFWVSDEAQYLSTFVPFLGVLVLHAGIAAYVTLKRGSKKEKKTSVISDAAAAAVFFPGISWALMKVLAPGLGFAAVVMIRKFTAAGFAAGGTGALAALCFAGFTTREAVGNPLQLKSDDVDDKKKAKRSHRRRNAVDWLPAIATFFVPQTPYLPPEASRRMFPYVHEVRAAVFAPADVWYGLFVAACCAVQPESSDGCVTQYALLAGLFLLSGVATFALRPYRVLSVNIVAGLNHFALCAYAVSAAVEADEPGGTGADVIEKAVWIILVLSVLRGLLSIVAFYYEFRSSVSTAASAALTTAAIAAKSRVRTAQQKRRDARRRARRLARGESSSSGTETASDDDDSGIGDGDSSSDASSVVSSLDDAIAPIERRRRHEAKMGRANFRGTSQAAGLGGAPPALPVHDPTSSSFASRVRFADDSNAAFPPAADSQHSASALPSYFFETGGDVESARSTGHRQAPPVLSVPVLNADGFRPPDSKVDGAPFVTQPLRNPLGSTQRMTEFGFPHTVAAAPAPAASGGDADQHQQRPLSPASDVDFATPVRAPPVAFGQQHQWGPDQL